MKQFLLDDNYNTDPVKIFPNGFQSWIETHHEIVEGITTLIHTAESFRSEHLLPKILKERRDSQGTGGMHELAEELTNEFENLHTGRQWDGEFFDELENFLLLKFKE